MSVPAPSVLPAVIDPEPFSEGELFALAGFLAGYSGLTYEAYALDLRQYASYCAQHRLALFAPRRAHIETFPRYLEAAGKARARLLGGSALSRASTATPNKKDSSITP
jgi:hypothetical protein